LYKFPSGNEHLVGPLIDLFKHMDTQPTGGNVRPLVEKVGLAEDPHEFLLILLFDLKHEIQADESIPTFIDTLFFGKQKVIRHPVNESSKTSEREESFVGISLEVSNHSDMLSSLFHFRQSSLLMLDQQSYEQRIEFTHVPPVLIVHLNRIAFDLQTTKETKLCHKYEYPTKFPLLEGKLYRLFCVIVHRGGSSTTEGHFYAFIKRNKIWYRFDDENVDIVSKKEVLLDNFGGEHSLTHAYILIYLLDETK